MLLPHLRGGTDAETAFRFWHSAFDLLSVTEAEPDGRLVRVNPRWTTLLGYSEAELLSRPSLDFVHEDDRVTALEAMRDLTAGRATGAPFECRLRRADGTTLWTRWSGCYDPESGLVYSVARDITQEREALERLTFVQRLIERGVGAATVSEVAEGVVTEVATFSGWMYGEAWRADGDVLRHLTSWTAFPPLEAFGSRSAALELGRGEGMPGYAWQQGRTVFGAEREGARSCPRIDWPEGERLSGGVAFLVETAEQTLVFAFFDDREVVRDEGTEHLLRAVIEHTGTLLDRAEALDLVRTSRAQLEAVINAMPASISVKDLDGRFVHVNEAYARQSGRDVADFPGRRARDLLEPHVLGASAAGDERVVAEGRPSSVWREFETPRGRRDFQITKFPVHDDAGEIVALGSIAADVTELRDHERDMTRLHEELREQHRELEAFTITLSHDLRAPLRGIAFGAEEALTSPSAAKAAANLERIRDEALALATVLDDLLGYSWASRQPMDFDDTDVHALVESLLERHEPEISARGVEVDVGDLPPCLADETLLVLALDNLLTNALKFTRPVDAPRISIRGGAGDDEVVYSVVDNGVGFDAAEAGDLFEMFTTAHDRDEFEGTGVGLAIVQRTATRHGGRVWVESDESRGAAFHLALPARTRSARDE